MARRQSCTIQKFFLPLYFLSVGLQVNITFLKDHIGLVMTIVIIILDINSAIKAIVFRLFKETWRNSIYAGAKFSPIRIYLLY
jgi:monovalent cation:H+ antiporter-2, CPA2 family